MILRRSLFSGLLAAPMALAARLGFRNEPPSATDILKSFDARDWARHFMEHYRANPAIVEEECMTTWFACALMRGYDERSHRNSSELARLREENEDMMVLTRGLSQNPDLHNITEERRIAIKTLAEVMENGPSEKAANTLIILSGSDLSSQYLQELT